MPLVHAARTQTSPDRTLCRAAHHKKTPKTGPQAGLIPGYVGAIGESSFSKRAVGCSRGSRAGWKLAVKRVFEAHWN